MSYYNAPGSSARRSISPQANTPGQGRSEYPRHYARQGEHPHSINGTGHGGAYLGIPVSPRLQPGVGHGVSVNHPSRPPMPRIPRPGPALSQPYLVAQPPNVLRARPPSNVPLAQGVSGGPYSRQGVSSHNVRSSLSGSFPGNVLPVEPRSFDLVGDGNRFPPPMPVPQPFIPSHIRKRRALIIGVNYAFHPNPAFRLRVCVEDAYAMANFLCAKLGFAHEHITIMTDYSQPWNLPTKDNILREMKALVQDAQPHDSFFLYFSGHAIQIKDLNGDETDGLDECICAMDYLGNDPYPTPDTPGLIVDDLMHEIMVIPLPIRCRLTAVFDSCHSGTLLDLPYLYNAQGIVKEFRHPNRLRILRLKSSYADVVSLGASKDSQIALETTKGGALRQAFMKAVTVSGNNLTYKQLIRNLREDMKRRGFPQRPLLSSSYEIDTNLPFIV